MTVNFWRRLEKKLFCGVHHNSQQTHLKQKYQSVFVKGDVSRGNPGRIPFLFQFFNYNNVVRKRSWTKRDEPLQTTLKAELHQKKIMMAV